MTDRLTSRNQDSARRESPRPATLADLERGVPFAERHIGPRPGELAAMLAAIGATSLDELADAAVPAAIRDTGPVPSTLPPAATETEVLAALRALAARNTVTVPMIGLGYHGTTTPPVIRRHVLENPAWYTAYTPYQPEISQGRLEALLTFQTTVADLTGLAVAGASLLDEATAAAEAMTLLRRANRSTSHRFLVDADTLPQTLAVLRTRAEPLGIELDLFDPADGLPDGDSYGMLLSYPGASGAVRDLRPVIAAAHERGALVAVAADLLALTLLAAPGELGADVAVGTTQRFGVPLGFGGPHAGYLSVRGGLARQLPGRLVGLSHDADGRPALRLALQTREQHIRREKATSNICTAQALLAIMSGMYAAWHGPEGLEAIATRVHALTVRLARGLGKLGLKVKHASVFDTLRLEMEPAEADRAMARAHDRKMNLRRIDGRSIGISLDETTRPEDVEALWSVFAAGKPVDFAAEVLGADVRPAWAPALARKSAYLTHPVFHRYRSETEMLRYIKRLEAKDLSLTYAMIPLGSCTMKLNATAEMIPVTFPGFSRLHPFAPAEQTEGYQQLFRDLERMLAEITGFAAVSLQPNAGSQGEYAGLLVIRKWHESRGDRDRKVCLIPASAHGTNPASAVMAGFEVVVVKSDEDGSIDLADLEAKSTQHAARLGALMVTYPSTHGVFEEEIRKICDIVHGHGGQVYMDGANMNAQVGLCRPGDFGPDVCHLNLHKTFCIPHGGGGPGMGPICVAAHLAPFLPGHPVVKTGGAQGTGPVSAAPWGSASILVISYAYIRMMGAEGLTRATEVAILNANYIASRLADAFPVLYRGARGRVAHECILDLRGVKRSAGIEVDDVAKRLIDYGFHAPTVSFPVSGTLMVEPTESESKAELDRFCDAMISIRAEVAEVEAGRQPREGNVLKHAPHTAVVVTADGWDRPYPRQLGAFPSSFVRASKFWPSVGRLNNVLGDRKLICSCPPVEDYA